MPHSKNDSLMRIYRALVLMMVALLGLATATQLVQTAQAQDSNLALNKPVAVSSPTPTQTSTPIYKDPTAPVSERVNDLLARMTLDEKIGQMTQVERSSLQSDQDIAVYKLGSLLSGGGSAPRPNNPQAFADMVDG